MKASKVAVAFLSIACACATTGASTILHDFDAGIGPVANHPYPTSAFGTWYDITSDAFATPLAGTLEGSPALRIEDGGFTNGVYTILESVIPATGLYRLEALMKVNEVAGAANGIRAYQMGAVVNGVHRTDATIPNDIAPIDPNDPGSAVGDYIGLTPDDDSGLAPQIVSTGTFFANMGDNLLIAFSTDLVPGTGAGDFDDNSATWAAGTHVLVDNVTLVAVPEPSSLVLVLFATVVASAIGRQRK